MIWTKRNTLVVLRGNKNQQTSKYTHESEKSSSPENLPQDLEFSSPETIIENRTVELNDCAEPIKGTLFEREVNRLLDGLGPRFIDWWWSTPLPVDADLLPEVVPNYMPPFRFCPPNMRPNLTDEELTYLRKLARPLPTHFALGNPLKFDSFHQSHMPFMKLNYLLFICIR